jgi:hypothetical protein
VRCFSPLLAGLIAELIAGLITGLITGWIAGLLAYHPGIVFCRFWPRTT